MSSPPSPGAQPDLQRADDVAAAQRRQHRGAGHARRAARCSAATVAAAVSARLARPATTTTVPVRRAARRSSASASAWLHRRQPACPARSATRAARRSGSGPLRLGASSMIAAAPLLGGVAQAQVQDRQLFLEVRPEQHDGRRRCGLVDRGPRQAEHAGRQPVAELGVDVRRADRRRWPAWPRRRRPRSCRGRRRGRRCSTARRPSSASSISAAAASSAAFHDGRRPARRRARTSGCGQPLVAVRPPRS